MRGGSVLSLVVVALAVAVVCSAAVSALTVTAATRSRLERTAGRATASLAEEQLLTTEDLEAEQDAEAEAEADMVGDMESDDFAALTQDDLDEQSAAELAASTHQQTQTETEDEIEMESEAEEGEDADAEGGLDSDRMTEQEIAAKEAQLQAKEAALAEKEAKRKADAEKRAAEKAAKKAEAEKKKAEAKAKKAEEQKKKAEEKKAKKDAIAKKKAEDKAKKAADKKKKAEEKKKKAEEKKKQREEAKKKKEEEKKKRKHKLRKIKEKKHGHGSHHPPPDPLGHPDTDHHSGPSDLASGPAEWRTAGTVFPPPTITVKSYVLSIGSDNIKVTKVKGGHRNKPLTFKFDAGWETPLNKVIEQWKSPEKLDGVLYYVDRSGKSVARLSFQNAVLQKIRWPKMTTQKEKKEKSAKFQMTLQPETTQSEFFTKPEEADPAPELDSSKLVGIKRDGFAVQIADFDDAKVEKMRLPTVSNRLKSATRFGYNKESKKQEKQKTYSVTEVRRKPLRMLLTGKPEELQKWKTWKNARPPQPKQGTVTLKSENGSVYTVRLTNLYPNRVQREKDKMAVDLTFDTMEVEKSGGD